jgi:hypothetical protein
MMPPERSVPAMTNRSARNSISGAASDQRVAVALKQPDPPEGVHGPRYRLVLSVTASWV